MEYHHGLLLHSRNCHTTLSTCSSCQHPCFSLLKPRFRSMATLDFTHTSVYSRWRYWYLAVTYLTSTWTMFRAENFHPCKYVYYPLQSWTRCVVSRGILTPLQSNTSLLLTAVFLYLNINHVVIRFDNWSLFCIRCISTLNHYLVHRSFAVGKYKLVERNDTKSWLVEWANERHDCLKTWFQLHPKK